MCVFWCIFLTVPCVFRYFFYTCNNYSVDIFSYSGPSKILGCDGKPSTASAGARGVRIVELSMKVLNGKFSSTDSIKPSLLFS